MHILLIHQAFAALDEPGGTRHHEMARYLVAEGHRVTVIASPVSYLTGEPGRHADQDAAPVHGSGITIKRTYTYPAIHRSFVHRVFSFLSFMISSFFSGLRVRDVDLVWGTSPPIFQGITAWALARLKRAPFLFEVRDLWPAFAIGVGVLRNRLLIYASERLERFLYRHADLVVVNSPGFIDHVKTRGARTIELVPNGADPTMFDPESDGAEFRATHSLEDQFVALYAGAHGISNDLEVLLRAAESVRGRPEITFVLIGDGKEKPALEQAASEMHLTNLRFLPPVTKFDIPDALAAADACIAILRPIPQYRTVFPNKVFDYMAAGRPVVLAIDGVIRDLIEGAGAGIYVPPGDHDALAEAVCRLADNPDLRVHLGSNGRACVESQYHRATLTARMADIMAGLIEK